MAPFLTIKTQGGNDSEAVSVEILVEKKEVSCEADEAKVVQEKSSVSGNGISRGGRGEDLGSTMYYTDR